MARLNEPPASTDSIETLRKKLLRQNRDLAKSNNVRALRIRELENDCACMLSENLELRSRILELEKELEDNDARRIADHALAIREKLESQLTEWGILLAGLGLEPPMKRFSPRVRRSSKPRTSFSSVRPSPSQRRLRDIARDIEELGQISEHKSYPRMSMDPEQIRALRSEAADSVDSPELGPPPMSHFIDEDPVKFDSPSRPCPVLTEESPKIKLEASVTLESPQTNKFTERSPSPEKKKKEIPPEFLEDEKPPPPRLEMPASQPTKAGSKRKLAARDDMVTAKPQPGGNENQPPRVIAGKPSMRERVGNKSLKELASTRKDAAQRAGTSTVPRKPLAAKSTNNDLSSPKKTPSSAILDEIAAAKADLIKSKASNDRPKSRTKNSTSVIIDSAVDPTTTAPRIAEIRADLGTPVAEPVVLSPSSPETANTKEVSRGGTPPPTDINTDRDPPRPSRRNRTTVSYAEPNLRDKMRRPTKELYDAVSGEGKYSRRSSNIEVIAPESAKSKKEDDFAASWKKLPPAPEHLKKAEDVPASPLAGKGSSPLDQSRERIRRTSTLVKESVQDDEIRREEEIERSSTLASSDTSNVSEVDIYEFTTSSPQPGKEAARKKTSSRRATRRVSSAVTGEGGPAAQDRASRRRSMML
ncbi:hypothetical protein BGZ63DRAFT_416550 [Mariannaea sp. PMI_226]|nr:hypothetical protein BGZ63DRAFT_416550 [Mariannaea sp. PMI_226]